MRQFRPMTTLELNVLHAARSVADASRLDRGWVLSETLRQLRASLRALDDDTPPHLAPIPESLGALRTVRSVARHKRRISRK